MLPGTQRLLFSAFPIPLRSDMRTPELCFLLVALLSVGCLDSGSSPQERRSISTDAAPEAVGPYSQAIQMGNQIYCSGQIGIDPATGSLVEGGIEAETRQALEDRGNGELSDRSGSPFSSAPFRWRQPASGSPWSAACCMASTKRSNSSRVVYTDGDTRMP